MLQKCKKCAPTANDKKREEQVRGGETCKRTTKANAVQRKRAGARGREGLESGCHDSILVAACKHLINRGHERPEQFEEAYSEQRARTLPTVWPVLPYLPHKEFSLKGS